jgi:hypothetical protein
MMRKFLVTVMVAGSVIVPGSRALAAPSACLNHSLTTDATVQVGHEVFIDESASKCAVGQGIRVKIASWVLCPKHRAMLGPVVTFLGSRDVVTFYPVQWAGTYTVITRITTPNGRRLAIDRATFVATP